MDETSTFSIHRHCLHPKQLDSSKQLQVVTQSLNILPTLADFTEDENDEDEAEDDEDGVEDVERVQRLRGDMRKLREYLKTSVQERKLLLKKIGSLNEKLAEKGLGNSNRSPLHNSKYLLVKIGKICSLFH